MLSDVIKVCWTLNKVLSVNLCWFFTMRQLGICSVNYLLVGRSVAFGSTCCKFYGKPSRKFLVNNFRRILRGYLIAFLWAQLSCQHTCITSFSTWANVGLFKRGIINSEYRFSDSWSMGMSGSFALSFPNIHLKSYAKWKKKNLLIMGVSCHSLA